MAVSLSVKNVPEVLAAALRRRARQNHRSLQGELLAILHEAVAPARRAVSSLTAAAESPASTWTPLSSGSIAPRSEAALIIRAARDGRTKTIAEVCDALAALGGQTPSESARIIRKSRSRR
jgi:plasmid stability protein